MKLTVRETKQVDVKFLHINVPVRYEEEDIPNDFPLREGDVWKGTVDLDTHRILEWPRGKTGSMHMKVCDEGIYTLQTADLKTVAVRKDYCPNKVIPGEWGDYIELEIAEDGTITNWPEHPSLAEFETKED